MPKYGTLETNFDYPPIPERNMDWSACEDPEGYIGRGPTELAAVIDFYEHQAEELRGEIDKAERSVPYAVGLRQALERLNAYISWRVSPDYAGNHHILKLHMEDMRKIAADALASNPIPAESLEARKIAPDAKIDPDNITDKDCADLAACIEREVAKKVIREVYERVHKAGFRDDFKMAVETGIEEVEYSLLEAWGENPGTAGPPLERHEIGPQVDTVLLADVRRYLINEMAPGEAKRDVIDRLEKALAGHQRYISPDCESRPLVTRVEVIDASGRAYVKWDDQLYVQLSTQDDERTLKVFIREDSTHRDPKAEEGHRIGGDNNG